jgi:hypothetical protein
MDTKIILKRAALIGVLMGGMAVRGHAQPAPNNAPPITNQVPSLNRSFAGSMVLLRTGDTLRGPLTYIPDKELIVVTLPDLTQRTYTPTAVRAFVVKGEIGRSLASITVPGYSLPDKQLSSFTSLYKNPNSPFLSEFLKLSPNQVFVSSKWPAEQMRARRAANGFFEVLTSGNIMLLQREQENAKIRTIASGKYQLRPSDYSMIAYRLEQSYGTGIPTHIMRPELYHKHDLYLSMPDRDIVSLRHPRRVISACFPAHKKAIASFVQQHSLSWNKPEDLMQVVAYLNSLSAKL